MIENRNKEIKLSKEDRFPYDTKEDIKKCLQCSKPECNNCLIHKNFV